MLTPLPPQESANPPVRFQKEVPEPIRTCEACGKKITSSLAINCIIVIGSPGHPTLAPFQCAHEEHWACSIGCWNKVAHACIDEHMSELLRYKHSEVFKS